MTTPPAPPQGFDPEAEQEVDFALYARMLAARWWLLAAGLVVGAVIGYLVTLGGAAQVYSAQAVIYLGQPYNPTGTQAINTPQTNPSAVGQVVKSEIVGKLVAKHCKTNIGEFRKGISTQTVASNAPTKGTGSTVNPLVTVSVQAKKGKVATCTANGLAGEAVKRLGAYPAAMIAKLEQHIAFDNNDIKTLNAAIANPALAITDKLLLQGTLRNDQQDLFTTTGLLLEAKSVELPHVLTPASANKVTARSRRNTVLVAALIGLILGILAALLWDRVVPRLAPRNGS